MRQHLKKIRGLTGFTDFIKSQGVVGLAIGFILGGAISKFVTSLVTDIINPIINGLLGGVDDLGNEVFKIGKVSVHYGAFLNNGIDFIVVALVVYGGVKLLKVDQAQIKVPAITATSIKK
ncbi:MAG: MscL family protein [Candidatus Nomurabacteria bacterium]|nr:MscL family protein [Candidatus Nomurabacteria bacterium]